MIPPTATGILALVMWACMPSMVALSGQIAPFLLASLTMFIGFTLLTLCEILRGASIAESWKQPARHYFFVVGAVSGYTALLYYAFKTIPPFEANTLNYLWPILLIGLNRIIYGNNLGLFQSIGIMMGFFGFMLLFYPEFRDHGVSQIGSGHLAAIMAAFIWAGYSVGTKQIKFPYGFMAPVFFVSGVICTLLHIAFEETNLPIMMPAWLFILGLGIFRIAYAFWDYAMKYGDSVFLASLSYFLPLLSTFLLTLCGFTATNSYTLCATIMIVAGCIVSNINKITLILERS